MPWVKIDDHFDEHPKLAAVGPPGWGYWLAGLAYCNRNLTDGFIPYSVAYNMANWQVWDAPNEDGREKIWTYDVSSGMGGATLDGQWIVARLVAAGLWKPCPGGFRVHDFLEYNPSKADVIAERARWATKKARQRKSPTMSPTMSPGDSTGESHGESRLRPDRPVPVPVPLDTSNEASNYAREEFPGYDGRADLEAFMLVTRRAPTPKQRKLLDMLLTIHDLTGPQWAADIIMRHPDDPIGAVIEADKAYRAERIAAAQAAEKPKGPAPRKHAGLTGINAELATIYAAQYTAERKAEDGQGPSDAGHVPGGDLPGHAEHPPGGAGTGRHAPITAAVVHGSTGVSSAAPGPFSGGELLGPLDARPHPRPSRARATPGTERSDPFGDAL